MSDNVKKALLMAMTATNDSGYNAVQQMVGFLATGDETYLIPQNLKSHNKTSFSLQQSTNDTKTPAQPNRAERVLYFVLYNS